ncbi:MAG: hypothetical protein CM15mP84_05300 [Cellvibrionales bacterium]|nr:MAG: hypothetical protein CM15mP84_05300 [Cellvibrionales bacterium]
MFKDAPAGKYTVLASPSLGSFPSTWPMPCFLSKKLSLRPEEGSVYGQFNYTMQKSEFTCSGANLF